MKFFLRVENKIYDMNSGEKVTLQAIRKRVVIDFTDLSPHTKKAKKVEMKYIYKSKRGKFYIVSPSLATTFLRDVLYDYTGKNRVVIESPAVVIAFLGEHQEYLVSTDQEEREKFLERIYQGLDYEIVPIQKAYFLVRKSNTKKIALVVIVLGVLGLIAFMNLTSPPPKPVKRFVKKAPLLISPEENEVKQSQAFLYALMVYHLQPYEIISSIDFSALKIRKKALIPVKGYRKAGKWYVKDEKLTGDVFKITKQPAECFNNIKHISQLLQYTGDKLVLKITRQMDVKETGKLIKNLTACPLSVTGNIQEKNLFTRNVNLKVTIYNRRF